MNARAHPLVFVLGVERSGSTWLSNIFDSSPDVLFYMEPFADFAEIFRGFPGRLTYQSAKSGYLEDLLVNGLGDLYRYKYPLLDGHDRPRIHRMISRWILRGHDRALRLLRGRSSLKGVRYQLLNLHRSQPGRAALKKKRHHSITVVKELRLNFKIGLLKSVFPQARYVAVVRHPVAQLHSIMRLFSRGQLEQLRLQVCNFLECIAVSDRFEKYREVLMSLDHDSMLDRLVAYWFVNYNTLLEDLAAMGCDYTVVRHELLSEDPQAVVRQLFEHCGCRFTESTKRYVLESSTFDNQAVSPLDTRRDSRRSYLDALSRARNDTGPDFRRSSRGFWELSADLIREYETRL